MVFVTSFLCANSVTGQIAITRSLGDHLMKDYISGEPHLYQTKLTESDSYLIIACDGVCSLFVRT